MTSPQQPGAASADAAATSTASPRRATGALVGRELLKGHASGHDLLVLIDPGCETTLSAADVTSACDRHTGAGADGLVRLARTASVPGTQALAQAAPEAEWFVDAYASDGTPLAAPVDAVQLAAAALTHDRRLSVAEGGSIVLGTRAGARAVTRLGSLWTTEAGPARLPLPEVEEGQGWDTAVTVPGLEGPRAALTIAMPEHHLVIALGEEAELSAARLGAPQGEGAPLTCTPAPRAAHSLGLVLPLGDETDPATGDTVGLARVRTLTPGAGETSCSASGCCAVATALHHWAGEGAPQDYRLLVPGGEVGVHVGEDPLTGDDSVLITGPAVVTGRVRLL